MCRFPGQSTSDPRSTFTLKITGIVQRPPGLTYVRVSTVEPRTVQNRKTVPASHLPDESKLLYSSGETQTPNKNCQTRARRIISRFSSEWHPRWFEEIPRVFISCRCATGATASRPAGPRRTAKVTGSYKPKDPGYAEKGRS